MKTWIAFWLVVALLLPVFQPSARAADAVVGTGSPASCTEAAFEAALAVASSGGGVVTFNCGPNPHTITFTSTKNLPADVTLDGGGLLTLSGNGAVRLLRVTGNPVVVDNLHLTQGSAVSGGAIQVASGGHLTLRHSQLSQNTASNMGGALHVDGGTAILTQVALTGNNANYGGGIYNNGTLTLNDVILSGNTSVFGGGGMYNNQAVTLNNVTLATNTSGDGGGVFNTGTGNITLNNVTLSGNQANYGGGMFNNGLAQLTNVTLANNSAQAGGGVLHNSGAAPQISLLNVIFSGNVASSSGDQCLFYKAPASLTYSLWSGTSCGNSPVGNNQPNTQALLAPLGFTGTGLPTELTPTHAPLVTSPAVEAGLCTGAPVADQRGLARPQGATCDIGAVELLVFTVYLPFVTR